MELYIGVIVGFVILLLLIYAFINYRRISDGFVQGIDANGFEPIIKQLETKVDPDEKVLAEMATNVATRQNLFHVLKSYHRLDLYPNAQYSIESGAASNLVNWVAMEENLAYPPKQIEMMKAVVVKQKHAMLTYYTFKFKIDPPHFAAERGWLIGVVGPYNENSKPFDWPSLIISRFKSINDVSPEEEAQWAHQTLSN